MEDDWIDDGGRVCLDFVNTLRDRKLRARETVASADELRRWLVWAGVLSGEAIDVDLEAAYRLRDAVDQGLLAVAGGGLPGHDDLDLLNKAAALAPSASIALVIVNGRLEPRQAPRTAATAAGALGLVAADALELMISPEIRRVRICGADDCGLRFVDRSPAGNRRWCSMTRCGNRMKARLHQQRVRRGSAGSAGYGPTE